MIRVTTCYTIKGKDYKGINRARESVENDIGLLIDRINDRRFIDAGTKLAILAWIVDNRQDIGESLGLLAEIDQLAESDHE